MKVIADTNVFFSAFFFQSKTERCILSYVARQGELYIPKYVTDEIRQKVEERFPSFNQLFEAMYDSMINEPNIHFMENMNQENEFLASLMRDTHDIPILLTIFDPNYNFDFFVTKDKDFLAMKTMLENLGFDYCQIIDTGEFMNSYPDARKEALGYKEFMDHSMLHLKAIEKAKLSVDAVVQKKVQKNSR